MRLEHNALARLVAFVKENARVCDVGQEFVRKFFQMFFQVVRVDGGAAVSLFDEKVFPFDNAVEVLIESLREAQVAHANDFFQIFVAVNGCDTAAGAAVFRVAEPVFFQTILTDVIRHADYRAVADFKVVGSDYDAFFAKGRDFFMKVRKVDNHTVAHYAGNFGTKYARGKKI